MAKDPFQWAAEGPSGAQTTVEVPDRASIPEEDRWRLEDIFPNDEAWEAAFHELEGLIDKLAAFRGTLGQSGEQLLAFLQLNDEVGQRAEALWGYAHMRLDEDTTHPESQGRQARALNLLVRLESAVAFATPEILAIPPEQLERFLQETPGLEGYRHALDEIQRRRPHTLSEAEERLLAMAGEVGQSPAQIFQMINEADIRFPTVRDEAGREVEITHARFLKLMESRDRRVRRETFQGLYATYQKQRNTLAATLAAQVQKNIFFARARRFGSALEAALFPSNIPVSVYTNLIETVRQGLPALHRYMALRKRALGLDEHHMYDIYTPIVPEVTVRIPWQEAQELAAAALAPLGEEYVRVLREGFRSRWIDVYENRGKRSGAYSTGVYGVHPYVLLNYQETLDDLFTLVHEMGHALHTYFSNRAQPYVYANYSIFVAEVASTLNEALLAHHLLERWDDRARRLYVLNHQLDTFRTTLFRQTMFAEFEQQIHQEAEAGRPLTAERLAELYGELNAAYHGPAVVNDEEIRLEWARIPHFYMNFYVYQYATGFSAAQALARRILEEGQPAVEAYLAFLSSGSSDYPLAVLQRAGVDMTSPEPVRQAIQAFHELVQELERLLEP
ncbi:MAG: oligoendopeptidase F [Limnochorda sp.]|uniref:oligoendopeptidase F n=1 Tax=Limnochorda sp. TaxID=1940279 RepID=UPI001EB78D7A|nr:oligoendopeptidase F [Bacillota bacterium]